MGMINHHLDEICGNCGQRRGLHKADDNLFGQTGLCPGKTIIKKRDAEVGRDWNDSPGTTFWGIKMYRPYQRTKI
jgi:hypothetical protein